MIRLCIADDQTLVRQGIRSLLQVVSEFTVVAEARDGLEVLEVLRTTDVDELPPVARTLDLR